MQQWPVTIATVLLQLSVVSIVDVHYAVCHTAPIKEDMCSLQEFYFTGQDPSSPRGSVYVQEYGRLVPVIGVAAFVMAF